MSPHYDGRMESPAVRRMRLDDDEVQSIRQTLRILNKLRLHAEQAGAEDLNYALCRALEVLATLSRHRGEVWLQ